MMKAHTLYDGLTRSRRLIAQVMIQCAAAIVICAFALSLATAADLIGTVWKSGRPVKDATVKLVPDNQPAAGQEKSTTTDAAGRYVISGVVPGRYKLICNGKEDPAPVDIGYAINRRNCEL
jgi:hypothetical protein